ncbi:unnamed protein product [Clonostachys rosea]|uniref:Xylanolytic transcriptional activator regulatory domain-containing protein n=1 Tax=Bionectria ochroleuca TaxID=29856 RepID=A0ABY6UEZ6_BIOOC|nr:unnamed protein product [Clonostachys rosea]
MSQRQTNPSQGGRRVTNAYLRSLQQQAAAPREAESNPEDSTCMEHTTQTLLRPENEAITDRPPPVEDEAPFSLQHQPLQTPISIECAQGHPEASNPLASASSEYVSDDKGRLLLIRGEGCLGESSTWSFARKTLMLARHHVDIQDLPSANIATNEESRAYPLSWSSDFEDPAYFTDLPSADYAMYLLNSLQFHIGQLYHLFDQSQFMKVFHAFYESPAEVARQNRIWYVQLLTLLGLAKALVVQPARDATRLPGTDLFIRAMSLLPDTPYLYSDALTSVETLCAISLFFQCADSRNSAYVYIGSALRMAITFGLHRERPTHDWGPDLTLRCQRAWWTVYILDRTFSSSMGVPIAIQDSDITAKMPSREGSRSSNTLYIHVKLSNLLSEVVNSAYLPC